MSDSIEDSAERMGHFQALFLRPYYVESGNYYAVSNLIESSLVSNAHLSDEKFPPYLTRNADSILIGSICGLCRLMHTIVVTEPFEADDVDSCIFRLRLDSTANSKISNAVLLDGGNCSFL